MENILETVKKFTQSKLATETTGHDWWHTQRVWKMALYLAKEERINGDTLLIQVSALLHDVWDWKFLPPSSESPGKLAQLWLQNNNAPPSMAEAVREIIDEISFKGAHTPSSVRRIEGKIVQDADRLDALGAIGIARTFAYGGYKKRQIHNPNISPTYHTSFEAYKNHPGTTINHFYEKLFLIKDALHTESAKKIAEKREAFMRTFIEQFFEEWET